ncbi:MAG: RluA family pseudouridine synthase [Erythrobacter sp.]|nr:MAG: RluA family pseudouridine synthase [Erythrobacter sp.]
MSTAPSDQVRQFTVDADDDGLRLDRWFKRHLPQVGFGTVSRWARTGQLRVDGKRVKPEDRIATGQVVRVPPGGEEPNRAPRPRAELTPEQEAEAEAMLITRTNSALVLNKPPGLATQGGTKTNKHVDGLLDAYANDDEARPRLVHRLDRDTSGVLLVARSASSAAFFAKRFASRGAQKIYWALVVGVPDVHEGTIDAPLAKQPGSGGEKMHVDTENGQTARTVYRVVERAGNAAAWVEMQPFTGRTHQLRVHMAAIGHPIVGDGKYGGQDAFLTGSVSRKMHLHARRLIIEAPKGETIDVTAPLPDHFAASMAQLGFDEGLSDASPLAQPKPERTKAEKKQASKAHNKQERRSKPTRRGRGAAKLDAKAEAKPPARKTFGKPLGKPVHKPKAPAKPPAKPRPKPKP